MKARIRILFNQFGFQAELIDLNFDMKNWSEEIVMRYRIKTSESGRHFIQDTKDPLFPHTTTHYCTKKIIEYNSNKQIKDEIKIRI